MMHKTKYSTSSTRMISWLLIITMLHTSVGCAYYKVKTHEPNEKAFNKVNEGENYIVLHWGGSKKEVRLTKIDMDNKVVGGTLHEVDPKKDFSVGADPDSPNRFRRKDFRRPNVPYNNIHIYLQKEIGLNTESSVEIPFDAISKIDIYDKAHFATAMSIVGTTVLGGAAVFGIVLIIVAATKSSCPFIYVKDGEEFRFIGESFGGAISSNLQRDDYMPLPNFTDENDLYTLLITNELLERQYTDIAELIVVDHHDMEAKILLDKEGKVHTIQSPNLPKSAISNTGEDKLDLIRGTDEKYYLFDDFKDSTFNGESNLVLTFDRPEKSNNAKLVLNAKNSFWLEYIFNSFHRKLGTAYDSFAEKQKNKPGDKARKWAEQQQIPLLVSIENEGEWELVETVDLVGPLASRDIVVPLDLSAINQKNVKVKLECGFAFWELDYVGMDYSANLEVDINRISCTSATDEDGTDIQDELKTIDGNYLYQDIVGNIATINYQLNPLLKSSARSIFLHTSGYYEYIRNYTNEPNIRELKKFKKKGAFNKYSFDEFFRMSKISVALNNNQ